MKGKAGAGEGRLGEGRLRVRRDYPGIEAPLRAYDIHPFAAVKVTAQLYLTETEASLHPSASDKL